VKLLPDRGREREEERASEGAIRRENELARALVEEEGGGRRGLAGREETKRNGRASGPR
jgi:hypothetical protein